MSGPGPERTPLDAAGLRVAVVAASWHTRIMDGLLAGAMGVLDRSGAEVDVVRVPGSFELPVAAATVASRGADAVVALGVVIRGGTPHFEYVSSAATSGLVDVSVQHRIPVGFGVLTCDDEDQALARAGLVGSKEDKGGEAAHAALSTVLALRTAGDL